MSTTDPVSNPFFPYQFPIYWEYVFRYRRTKRDKQQSVKRPSKK